jgi:long-chain acyl-CoA synthetase
LSRKETLVDVFWERVQNTPERPAIMHKVGEHFRPVIWREHGRVVELICGGLLNLGLLSGEQVAIMCQTRPEWTWSDLAILSCGAASVPVYPTLASNEVQYLLNNSDSAGIFVENLNQLNKVLSISNLPQKLRFIVVCDGVPEKKDPRIRVLTWQDLLKDGEVYLLANPKELPSRIAAVKPEQMASIVYTSGTTGVPKGAMLLHSTFYAVCKAVSQTVGFKTDDVSLSFLPLSHVYERVGGQFFAIYEGLTMAYAESMEKVPQNMMEVRPTVLNGVPRFYEKAYQRIQAEIRKMPKPQQYLIRWALALGRRAAKLKKDIQSHDASALAEHFYRAELRVADRIVFSKIRRRFGGRLRVMVSGAAPLASEVQGFFETIGLTIVEGYGLTETAAPACCNVPENNKPGTVGKPLPDVEVKIAEDGEIMIKGPSVFAGYYKNEEATRQAFSDGWFLTGDIGELDSEGRLIIKDRKKDIIITAGGKHVAPQRIENMFKGDSLVSQILVYGDRRKFISALITLNRDAVFELAKLNGIAGENYAQLIQEPRLVEAVEAAVNERNAELATFERVKKFKILENDFTIEADELTPTLKIKRKVVTEHYKKILDSFYDVEDLELQGLSDEDLKLSGLKASRSES